MKHTKSSKNKSQNLAWERLNTVTTESKIIAVVVIFLMLVIAFGLGMKYQNMLNLTEKAIEEANKYQNSYYMQKDPTQPVKKDMMKK